MLNKYVKCNFGGLRCGTSTIVDIRRLKVNSQCAALSIADAIKPFRCQIQGTGFSTEKDDRSKARVKRRHCPFIGQFSVYLPKFAFSRKVIILAKYLRLVDRDSEHNGTLFFNNLMHKFFILIHLLHSSTCFEHYCAHLQEDNCINTASDFVTRNLCTEQSPKEIDVTRCCVNTIIFLKMSTTVLETFRGV